MTEQEMVKVRSYGRLVIARRRTIEEIPEMYRVAVQEWVDSQRAE